MKIAKMFLLTAALALCANAATFGITIPLHAIAHPVAAFHSVPADERGMFVVDWLVQNFNAVDYATTYRALVAPPPGSPHFCEGNKLLEQANGCSLNEPRFTGVKIGVLAFGVAQWVPVWAHRASPTYIRTVTIIDAAGAVPLLIVDINNIHQLVAHPGQ